MADDLQKQSEDPMNIHDLDALSTLADEAMLPDGSDEENGSATTDTHEQRNQEVAGENPESGDQPKATSGDPDDGVTRRTEDQADQAKQLLSLLEEMAQQRQSAKEEPEAQSGKEGQAEDPDDGFAMTPEQEQEYAYQREEFGEKYAEQYLKMLRMEHTLHHLKERQQQYHHFFASEMQDRQRRESDQAQVAIDAHPTLAAMQKAGGQEWMFANQLHQFAMQNMPNYAQRDWRERMGQLSRLVSAMTGSTPASQSTTAAQPTPDAMREGVAQKLKNLPATMPPTTHSDLQSGKAAETSGDITKKPAQELQVLLNDLASRGMTHLDAALDGLL